MSGVLSGPPSREGARGQAGDARWITVTVNLLGESAAALHVVGTRATDQPEWLPKSQVEMRPGALAAAKASRAAGRMALLEISLPRWLAVERGFAADVLEGQGDLF